MWFCCFFFCLSFYVSVIIPHIMMQNRPISCLLNIITKTPRKRRPVELNNGFMLMWFLMRCLTFNFNFSSHKSLAIEQSHPLPPPPVTLPFLYHPWIQLIAFEFFLFWKHAFHFVIKIYEFLWDWLHARKSQNFSPYNFLFHFLLFFWDFISFFLPVLLFYFL